MISFVIIQRHSTKSTSTYHLIPTNFPPYLSIVKHCIDEERDRSYYQPLFSAVIQFQSLPTSVVGSWPFYIRNHTGIGLSYKALQLIKAHKTEPAYDGACAKDVTPLHKYHALGTSVTKPRCTARWIQRSTALWCLFNSSTREADCKDIVLGHSPSEATSEEFSKEEALLNCWDGSWSNALVMHTA